MARSGLHNMRYLALDAFTRCLDIFTEEQVQLEVSHRHSLLLRMMGQPAGAITSLRRMLNLNVAVEEKARLFIDLAMVLLELGKPEEAIMNVEEAIALDPQGIESFLPLVECHIADTDTDTDWNKLIARMHRALKRRDTTKHLHADIFWALYSAYDANKKYSLAWKYLQKAHSRLIEHRGLTSTVGIMHQRLSSLQSSFAKSDVFPFPSAGSPSTLPVFIIGMLK